MSIQSLTPVLCVESIEECLPFWTGSLGFTKTMEVPHGDGLGFAMLHRDGVDVMLQSWASVADDVPALAEPSARGASFLFLKVDDLAPFETALAGADHVLPKRETFYGSVELVVREPGGHVVTIAHFPGEAAE